MKTKTKSRFAVSINMFFKQYHYSVKIKTKPNEFIDKVCNDLKDVFKHRIKQDGDFSVLEFSPKHKIKNLNSFRPNINLKIKESEGFTYIDACFSVNRWVRIMTLVFMVFLSMMQIAVGIIAFCEKMTFSVSMLMPFGFMILVYLFVRLFHYISSKYYKDVIFYDL